MNARQLKKQKKNSYFLGVATALCTKFQNDSIEIGDNLDLTIYPVIIPHNRHRYMKAVKLIKHLLKLAKK